MIAGAPSHSCPSSATVAFGPNTFDVMDRIKWIVGLAADESCAMRSAPMTTDPSESDAVQETHAPSLSISNLHDLSGLSLRSPRNLKIRTARDGDGTLSERRAQPLQRRGRLEAPRERSDVATRGLHVQSIPRCP